MLVLSRKCGEAIVIDGDIVVTVLDVHGDRVKLGFRSPAEVPIHRQEVYRKITFPAPPQTIQPVVAGNT